MYHFLKRCKYWITHKIWLRQRKHIKQNMQICFNGKVPTILSCNCIGGVLYSDLGLKFISPTINLYMNCSDYIKFLENLEYYLTFNIEPYVGEIEKKYPIGRLGDLILFLVHYSSVEEANIKWQERKKRMDKNNIFVIATDRDGFSDELLERFNALPYKKKIFTHIPVKSPDCVYIRGFETKNEVGNLMEETKGGKRIIDQFDWVNWFNSNN